MLTKNAITLLKKRYLLRNNKGKIIETPKQMFKRVAKAVSKNNKKLEKEFFKVLRNLDFLPNSPTLMNAGTETGQLSACFVLPIEDSVKSIFSTLKDMALIHKSGGGTGFNFSKIRPMGDIIGIVGEASGPVSFIEIYNKTTDVMKQGGRRRGANMAILNVGHPDILEFIKAKQKKQINNFNFSVAVTNKFMDAVKKGKSWNIVNPRTKKMVKRIKARKIFNAIIDGAWKTGDPGIIFIDEINSKNKLKLGKITTTNPCGEVPLYKYESCNLGSINLSIMVKNRKIDWKKLKKTVNIAVQFLDNVIDVNKYPLKIIEERTKANRKIGLGVMGFAEMLIKLSVPYDSENAVKIAEKIMKFIDNESKNASLELAKKRGAFPNFRKSKYKQKIRNATTTTIAPTGSISIIAGTTPGIEPLFALVYKRKFDDKEIFEYNKLYKEAMKKYKKIPTDIKRLFKTAHKIKPEQHVKIQAAFQKYTDNAVSKTVNLPKTVTRQDIKNIFMLAYKLKCKGITVYRECSKPGQIIEVCRVCK